MKPLLIGEAPSKNESLPRPLEGRIGRRLAACAGISFDEYLERFERVNLLDVRQDTKEKGFEFDRWTATKRALEIIPTLKGPRNVVLLGKRVADCFGVVKDWFEPHYLVGNFDAYAYPILYVVPHPSGVNRWWNDPAHLEQMRTFMRSLL